MIYEFKDNRGFVYLDAVISASVQGNDAIRIIIKDVMHPLVVYFNSPTDAVNELQALLQAIKAFRNIALQKEDYSARFELLSHHITNGDSSALKRDLKSLIIDTVGFEPVAAATGLCRTSMSRMLSEEGNPKLDNLCGIISEFKKLLKDYK